MNTETNIIPLWSNLSRAYEIAKLGNLSISIVFNRDYIEGREDYNIIKKIYSDVKFESDGDLIVEITKPDGYKESKARKHETISDLDLRIEKAKQHKRPEIYKSQSVSDSLLKTATERLSLTLSDIESIEKISRVIAQLDLANEIKVEHTAEAIQYRYFTNKSEAIIAESNTMLFGDHIKIHIADIDTKDIKAAINYLESL
jgi:hypothetical protein